MWVATVEAGTNANGKRRRITVSARDEETCRQRLKAKQRALAGVLDRAAPLSLGQPVGEGDRSGSVVAEPERALGQVRPAKWPRRQRAERTPRVVMPPCMQATVGAGTDNRQGMRRTSWGTEPDVSLLLIPLILASAFVLPFAMAWLEPKHAPTHRAASRRTTSR